MLPLHEISCMHVAAASGNNEVICILKEFGGDVNRLTSTGDTPMHFAAQK